MNVPPLPFDAATVWLAAAVCIAVGLLRSRTGDARARHAGLALGAVGAALVGWALAAPPRASHPGPSTDTVSASRPARVLRMDTLYAAVSAPPDPEPQPISDIETSPPGNPTLDDPAVQRAAAETPVTEHPIAPARTGSSSARRERVAAPRSTHPARPAPRRVVLVTPRPARAAVAPPASFRLPAPPRSISTPPRRPVPAPPAGALQRVTDDLGVARFHKERGEYTKAVDLLLVVDRQIAGLERDYPASTATTRLRRQAAALAAENHAACEAEAKMMAGTARAISCF